MKTNKAYKFRIYPNKKQIEVLEKAFGCSRFVYNHFLNQRNQVYKDEKRCMKYTEQQNQLPSMKKEFVWLKEVDSTSLQMSLRNLDTAFKNFFDGRADRPKFKSKRDNYKTYTSNFVNNNIDIKKTSSKICYECGYAIEDMPLNIREWKCPKCNSIHDRDINASKNILKQGLLEIA